MQSWRLPGMRARPCVAMLKRSDRHHGAQGLVMRMTAAMYSGGWLAGPLKERGLSLAGIGYATVRIAIEQCASRTAGQFGHELGSLVDHMSAERFQLVGCLLGAVAAAGTWGERRPTWIAVAMQVVPFGGPVWAGLITTSATYQGLRWLVARSMPPGAWAPLPTQAGSAPRPVRGADSCHLQCRATSERGRWLGDIERIHRR